jgi:hypothetical protein
MRGVGLHEMFRLLIIALTLLNAAASNARECTQLDAYAAEAVVDYLDSWRSLHRAFTQFRHCDDAAIAEGFSEAVARLLADKWSELRQFQALAVKEPEFEKFVLRHIDDTVTLEDRKKIHVLSTTHCPTVARNLCAAIAVASQVAQ